MKARLRGARPASQRSGLELRTKRQPLQLAWCLVAYWPAAYLVQPLEGVGDEGLQGHLPPHHCLHQLGHLDRSYQ